MPKFFYIARSKTGQRSSGALDASTQEEVISQLQAKGLVVINIFGEAKESGGLKEDVVAKAKFKPKHYRVTTEDLVLFCRQLATLLGAGVTILKSLDIISQQVSSRRLYNTLKDLKKSMEGGLSFHQALAKHSAIFPSLWVNLVESGEASGNLAVVLSRLAAYLERNEAFKKKVISALMYPAILFVAGLGALLFLSIKIIPTFVELFKGFNLELPFLTKVLVMVSDFLIKYLLTGTILFILGFFMLRKYIKTEKGRRQFERLLFNLPTFGEFFRVMANERFTAEMATLVESGVPILYSLEISERSVNSKILSDIIRNIKEDVRSGKPLSQPMERSGFFEPMAVQMVTIGEEIGELSNMFKRLNTFYEEYVDVFLTRFTTLFEPLMLVFIGAIVGIMVVGMFLPIFQITKIR